jgi:hypothetical protein
MIQGYKGTLELKRYNLNDVSVQRHNFFENGLISVYWESNHIIELMRAYFE